MFKHKSLTPTAISSRFSNWSYHDLGHAFNVFGQKEKAAAAGATGTGADDEIALTSENRDVVISTAKQWKSGRKVLHLIVTYQAVFLCSLATTTIVPQLEHADDQPEPNPILSSVPYAAFLIGMSAGWLFGSPVITLHRRRWPTITMAALFAGAQMAVGLSKGLILVSVFRALAGFFAAIVMSLCLANIQDMFANPSPAPYLLLMLIAGVACSFGPSYQHLLSGKIHHRWVSLLIMFALVPFMICTFFMHDSKPRASIKDASTTGFWRKIGAYSRLAIGRPIYLFFTHPSIMILSLSAGFNTAICYALYISLPSILATAFTQAQLEASLSTFALAVGFIVAFCCLLIYSAARARIDPPQDLLIVPISSPFPLPTIVIEPEKEDDDKASKRDDDSDEEEIKSIKSAKTIRQSKKKSKKKSIRISVHRLSHYRKDSSSDSESDSDNSSDSSRRSSMSNHDVEKAVKKSKKSSSPLHSYQTRWFWPMVPIVVLMPLALAFVAMTTKSWYPVFAPLAFVLIFAACAFVSLACGFLYIHERFDGTDKQSSAVAIYMFVVSGMSAGLCVVITHLLKSLALKALFGIFAGVAAFTSLVVLLLWLRLRRATS